jgi:hypothetical protein
MKVCSVFRAVFKVMYIDESCSFPLTGLKLFIVENLFNSAINNESTNVHRSFS